MSNLCIRRGLTAIALAASLCAAPALAQVQLTAIPASVMKTRGKVAIPAYHINFIIQQQSTAVAGIGARSRLTTMMTGVDPSMMKTLTNDAYADLRAKLVAAGVPVVDAAATVAATTEAERLPGNQDIKMVGSTITIGKGLAKGWATFGADEAPAIKAFHNPSMAPTGMMAAMGGARSLGAGSKALDAVMVMPNLTIDFVDMEASTGTDLLGRARASTGGELNFSLRAGSSANVVTQAAAGPAYALGTRLNKDVSYGANFAQIQTGEAAVRQMSIGTLYSPNYINTPNARGDAVAINVPVWEGMVRKAYGDFNTALVAAVVKARG